MCECVCVCECVSVCVCVSECTEAAVVVYVCAGQSYIPCVCGFTTHPHPHMHTDTISHTYTLTHTDADLESHGAVLQAHSLLPPVEEVAVVDDAGPEVRVGHQAGVVQTEVVLLRTDKPVTQERFPGSLTAHSEKS